MAVVALITVVVEIYSVVTNTETEEIYGFVSFAITLHNDLDESEVEDDILNLIDNISITQVEYSQEIHSTIIREASLIRRYQEGLYLLMCPTDEMRTLKESLIEESNLFLISYAYLGEALESKINDDYDTYLLDIEKAAQYLDDAMNLRIHNRAELEQWQIITEAELSN